jgi:hypothetical protein
VDRNYDVTFADLFKFYLPMVATSVLMMMTHSVVSGAVARTAAPTLALAAYSAAHSIGQIFESPCYGMQRMTLAFTHGKSSHGVIQRVGLSMLAFLLAVFTLLAWTPLSKALFIDVLGLTKDVYSFAIPSFRVFMIWPIVSTLRAFYQPIIVLRKKTYWTTVNMFFRVAFMFGAALILPKALPYGPVGAVILMIGIATEAVLSLGVVKSALPPLETEDSSTQIPNFSNVFKFALPLAIAGSLQNLAKPFITASLSRTVNPEVTLAGYQVALTFSYIFTSVTFNIYQLVMVFVRDNESFRKVRVFSVGMGILSAFLLVVCSVPGVGNWIFGSIIGTDVETTIEALRTLSVLAVTPALFSYVELSGGVLMLNKHTVYVTAAKLANVGVTSMAVLFLASKYPAMGGNIGALGLVAGALAEIAILHSVVSVKPDCREIIKGVARVSTKEKAHSVNG